MQISEGVNLLLADMFYNVVLNPEMFSTLNVKLCETFSGLLIGFHDGIFHRRQGLSHILPFTSFITIQICSIRINNAKSRSYFICINVYMFIEAFKINIHTCTRQRGRGQMGV